MNITPLESKHIRAAAVLFVQSLQQIRQAVPILPDEMEDPACTAGFLEHLLAHSAAVTVWDGDQLAGYLGWWLVDRFRDTDRKAAYCPVWAHAVSGRLGDKAKPRIIRELYRAAAAQWLAAKCQVHAISLLAHDGITLQTWFWNGFGLTVVDAVRSLDPLGINCPAGYSLRKATPGDIQALVTIEAEHWCHYAEPPSLMVANSANNADEFDQLLNQPENSVWAAWKGQEMAGYLRVEGLSHGAAEIVGRKQTAAITGAYVRPDHRGQNLAAALLDAVLAEYRERGYLRCSVDFESFNPEASGFWPKYFAPVCLSVVRVPERV